MLQQSKSDDYVIATGESHSVEEFLTLATEYAGLGKFEDFLEVDESIKRPTDIEELRGDSSKAQKQLNWKPKTSFKELVEMMVVHDIEFEKLRLDPIDLYYKTKT